MTNNVRKFPLVILAGAEKEDSVNYKKDKLLEYANVDYKALIELNGKPMILYVIKAFVESGRVSEILIVGLPKERLTIPDSLKKVPIHFIETDAPHAEKLIIASEFLMKQNLDTDYAMYIGGDVPTITPEAINDFLDKCKDLDADFFFSIIREETMNKMFPENRRTYARMKEGRFCGGDLQLVRYTLAPERKEIIEKILNNRKSVIKQAFFISPLTFFRFILHRVSIEEAEKLISKVIKAKMKGVISSYADLGFDVDKPNQLELVRNLLQEGKIKLSL
ncbi:MAG: hypothetical protein D6732_08710 [Methanobacteriota archaeon]|nr:MAG: hypothetical protein D6732_08710 [Euryarchaeota archaeon]